MAVPRNVLVTGANRGIGLGFVKHFLSCSPCPENVFAACRSARGTEGRAELDSLAQKHEGKLHVVQMDMTDSASIEKAASDVAAVVGENGLNLLINNAGVFPRMATLEDMDCEKLMHCFKTNTVGPTLAARAFLPQLKQASTTSTATAQPISWNRAAIINISSGMGSIGNNTSGRWYGYRASKSALNQVTRTLSIELGGEGILVVSVCPGWVQTDMGTQGAHLTVDVSLSAMTEFFPKMDASHNGGFFNRHGKPLEY